MRSLSTLLALGLTLATPLSVLADEVIFLNGDRLTGKIVTATGGKLVLKTDAAGDVTIDLAKVKTFSTDAPVQLRVGEQPVVTTPVAAGPEQEVKAQVTATSPPEPVAIASITVINPPPPEWKGSILLSGLFTTGNSETQQIGARGTLGKRWEHDRLLFNGEYSYGRQTDPDTGEKSTSVNYGALSGKYDHFFTKKFYGYALLKLEHDEVAGLNIRTTAAAGPGYQWFEGPTFNLRTETGIAYVYEDYEDSGSNQFVAPRFAYGVDWTPVAPITLFNTLEYLPSFSDFTGDYLLNIDGGVRAGMWKGLFGEFRVEYRYDSQPAPGRKKADTRLILGAGWEF